jgi:flagellar hook assembly protein FlgD
VPASLLVRAVFALLVAATVAAFFVTQRLKRSSPVVERVFFAQQVSPNGDGRKDSVILRFDLPEPDRVTVEVVDARGDAVRTLADDAPRGQDGARIRWSGETARVRWDGRTDAGLVAPDGIYRLRVTLREEGRSVTAPRELTLDTRPPRPAIVAVTPPTIVPGLAGRRGRVRIRFRGPQDPAPEFRVWRTDAAGPPREVARFSGPRFRETAEWDGTTRGGGQAHDGVYAFSVTVEDHAGNRGHHPRTLPPTRGAAGRRSGASVRYLTAAGPLVPVAAGGVARIEVGPVPRRLRWNLARVGTQRLLRRGRAGGMAFGVRIPADARTGLYLLRVQAGGRRAAVPLAVRRPGEARRVLLVLPAISWQGANEVDDDRDGFADTLDDSVAVALARPFAGGRPPAGFDELVSPLLRYLDRNRLSYDLTTDLALARATGPAIDDARGVLFAGSERWLTERLDLALREYVDRGGRVASFGTDAFRRRVEITPQLLADPSAPEPRNVFGEATAPAAIDEPAPMTVTGDRLGVFAGTDGFIGLFDAFEQSRARPEGSRLVAAAGRPGQAPAFVAYRLGAGLVIRAGSPQWAAQVFSRPEVGRVTEETWRLLAR